MSSPLLFDLARLAIQIASRSVAARQKANLSSMVLITSAFVLALGGVASFLVAASIFLEQEMGHQMAPLLMGAVFLVLSGLTLLVAAIRKRQLKQAQAAAANREQLALNLAMLLKDHKGLVLVSALIAGLMAGTSK